jgi:hypothetical protein
MKALAILLLSLASIVEANDVAPAFRQSCEQLPASNLVVSVAAVEHVVDQKFSVRELRKLVSARSREVVLSATELKGGIAIELMRRSISDPATGLHCARINAVIRLGDAPLEVHIAKEIPEGTCLYRLVLRHELRNVRNNAVRFQEVADELTALAGPTFVQKIWYGTLEGISTAARNELLTDWLGMAQALLRPANDEDAMRDVSREGADSFACAASSPAKTVSTRSPQAISIAKGKPEA